MSMFEPRATHKPFPIPTPKELMAGLPGRLPTIKDDKVGDLSVVYRPSVLLRSDITHVTSCDSTLKLFQ